MMQPPLESAPTIKFKARYKGTVEWTDDSATSHSAELNGPAVDLDVAQNHSATFQIPRNNGRSFPGLDLTFHGTSSVPMFSLHDGSTGWSNPQTDQFVCVDPTTQKQIGSVNITKDSDGILIVGTVDMGGEFPH